MTLIPLVLTAGAVAALTAVAVGAGGPPAPGAGAAPGSVARVGAPLVPVAGPALPGGGGPPTLPVLAAASFRWPLAPAPAVLRRFVVGPQPWSPGHRGVDLAATVGEQVLSAGAGVVAFAGLVAGRGVVSIVHTGGLRTTYEPVTAQVRAGETVTAGTVLGRLAADAHCTVPCLHWGALRGEAYLDPLALLRPPAPPVLLPLGRAAPAPGRGADAGGAGLS